MTTNEWDETESAEQLIERWNAGNAAQWELLAFIQRRVPTSNEPSKKRGEVKANAMTFEEAIAAARTEKFGEAENEPLDAFLSCESFEARPSEDRMRAFRLSAIIVSHVIRGQR